MNIHSLFSFAVELNCDTLGNNYEYILGNCYYFEASAYSFTKASEKCKDSFGDFGIGRIFEPRSKILNDLVIQEARTTVKLDDFWIGIRDSDSKNNWQYVSSNQTVSWTNWRSGQPDNNDGNPENCLGTLFKDSFEWDDTPCRYSKPSICELTTKKKGTCTSLLTASLF